MSGIYIPGMEMPRTCMHCAFALDGWCHATGNDTDMITLYDRPDYCPLIPVPHHGDLIDRDKLKRHAFFYDENDCYTVVSGRDVRNAPTIIPADRKDGAE